MQKFMLALGAMAMAVPVAAVMPADSAQAQTHHKKSKRYAYREWRGRDGRIHCRRSDGTTGAVIGAVGGALVGRTVDTHGERGTGTILGAIAGGLAGREIDRSNSRKRCR
ncbi:MAG: glycine zipper 2TM domain-containing protein [Pseudomonadota bacterium]